MLVPCGKRPTASRMRSAFASDLTGYLAGTVPDRDSFREDNAQLKYEDYVLISDLIIPASKTANKSDRPIRNGGQKTCYLLGYQIAYALQFCRTGVCGKPHVAPDG